VFSSNPRKRFSRIRVRVKVRVGDWVEWVSIRWNIRSKTTLRNSTPQMSSLSAGHYCCSYPLAATAKSPTVNNTELSALSSLARRNSLLFAFATSPAPRSGSMHYAPTRRRT